jgi:peptidyl-prolyl cis-trans isomerase D
MLDNLRANKGGIITYLFLGAIIVVFVVSFGPGSIDKGCKAADAETWAATVNGEKIPVTDYQRQYEGMLRRFQQQSGQAFTRELADQLGLPTMALNQVVDQALVLQEAHRQGLTVPDAELAQSIFANPAFQVDGRFDKDVYTRSAQQSYGTTTAFEKLLRDELLYERLLAGVRQTAKVSEGEIKEGWTRAHDTATVAFVRFPLAAAEAAAGKPGEAEVAAFAAKQPARVEQAYKAQAARFDQPKKIKARHVVVKVGPTAGAPEESAAKAKLEALAARIAKGEDFAKVASEASEDENTRKRGGDLGTISEGLVEKPFADAAFALAAGAVSAPVRTGQGWSLIKVEQVFPATKIPLEQARLDLARELVTKDRALALANEKAAAALAALKGGKKLTDLFPAADEARKPGKAPATLGAAELTSDTTGPFGPGASSVPRIGEAPALAAAALGATAGQVLGQVFETAQGPVVAVVTARERPDQARFAAERGAVADRLLLQRAQEVERAWLKTLRDGAAVKINPQLGAAAAAAVEG